MEDGVWKMTRKWMMLKRDQTGALEFAPVEGSLRRGAGDVDQPGRDPLGCSRPVEVCCVSGS